MRILEVIQAFPVFVFAVVLVTVFGGSTANIIAAVAFTDAPQQLRTETHLRIGRLLLAHTRPKKRTIFEIVNQINRGAALITSRDEREQIAELNLVAGKRAKASTAYTSALNYFIVGAALLADDSWERRHGLAFELELHRAGKGVNKTGHVQDFYPGEDRRVERFERSLGEFDTREESFLVLWAHFKRVSAGLKAWRSRRGKSL